MIRFDHPIQFITITCLNWLPFLEDRHHKQIILEALQTRVRRQQVTVYGFVIMRNHMHIIWQLYDRIVREDFQRDFLKFTARGILHMMRMNSHPLVKATKVKAADRKDQIWERNSLRIHLFTETILQQELRYIRNNPIQPKWRLADVPEDYEFSSARFYEIAYDDFDWLSHFRG